MLENYYDIITKIENFVDGLMVVDENCKIVYNKQFTNSHFSLDEDKSLGKTPMEIWPNLKAEDSTCYRAIKYGESTNNQIQKLEYFDGGNLTVIDNTFPIQENGKIIGAVSTSQYIDDNFEKDFIDLSNMTSTYNQNDLYNMSDIIGESKAIEQLKYKIHRLSKTDSSVLIYGETGTGKELVAQSIHSHSPRRNQSFLSQNCAAIPHTLLESIFFGTTKGSYTGAKDKPGIFEIADGGTIFLDEINSMDLNMQAKLLKAIEEQKITRIGGTTSKKMNVRIIAATNEKPSDCIKNGFIRKDLYYRFSSVQLEIPPLRMRKDDFNILANYFIDFYNKKMNKSIKGMTPTVKKMLYSYHWPGNVREFKNVIEGAFNFITKDVIQKDDLPDFIEENISNIDKTIHYDKENLNEALFSFEKNYIINKSNEASTLSELAVLLNISKQSLNYKIKKFNLQDLFN